MSMYYTVLNYGALIQVAIPNLAGSILGSHSLSNRALTGLSYPTTAAMTGLTTGFIDRTGQL